MRAVLTSFGSAGDVEPFLALAAELRRAGHTPIIALPPYFAERVRQHGFEYAAIAAQFDADVLRRVGTAQIGMTNPAEQVRYFLELTLPAVPLMYESLREICRGADVLISTPFQIAARMVHETVGVPLVSVHLSQFGLSGGKAVREASAPLINEYRANVGLAPLYDPLGADAASPQLALYAISSMICRRSPQWPSHHHVVGFFFGDEESWTPDEGLASFIDAGAPPAVITFGSVAHSADDAPRLTELVVNAVRQVGCRAVLQPSVGGVGRGATGDDLYLGGFIPHGWLFRHVGCVVHHGGAGTTAATLRAGVPTVVVPHTLDQPIWGELARALRCATAVIPYSALTVDGLAQALAEAFRSTRHRDAAANVGRRIREEVGVRQARHLIETLVAAAHPNAATAAVLSQSEAR
jgi:UDP:flavonoid glycosyltransferase YjiC (YdhE family)